MTGIPLEVMTHKLNIDHNYRAVKQKKLKQGLHRNISHQRRNFQTIEYWFDKKGKIPND